MKDNEKETTIMMEALLNAENDGENQKPVPSSRPGKSRSKNENKRKSIQFEEIFNIDSDLDDDYSANDDNYIDQVSTRSSTKNETTMHNRIKQNNNHNNNKSSLFDNNTFHSSFVVNNSKPDNNKYGMERRPSSPSSDRQPQQQKQRGDNSFSSNDGRISRVERSWYLISDNNRVVAVGEKFFLSLFDEYPEFVLLFPFGDDVIDKKTKALHFNDRAKVHIRAHASAVMRVVGTCVAGLTSIEELVPKLRSIGATHKMVGVQDLHYNIAYRRLIAAIKEEVGVENWDDDTEEAWEQAFLSITDLMKRPSKRLEAEPLKGWGTIMFLACTYFASVTPFRFAGFYIDHPNIIMVLDVLDFVSAMVMFLDLMVDTIQTKFRVSKNSFSDEDVDGNINVAAKQQSSNLTSFRRSWRQPIRKMFLTNRRRVLEAFKAYKMDRWVPWPTLDIKVLLSFVLQGMFVHRSLCSQIGLHWTQLFGLLRLSCASRVLHFIQCAENNLLLRQTLDANRQLKLRIVKLLVRLAFITHVCACLYCSIARLELGYDATEFTPSQFFPDPGLMYGPDRQVFNSYSRAVHWAFVSLSGIGNNESVPSTSLECWFTLIVHMIGAIFYAIVTGTVISVLEQAAEDENRMGTEILKLSDYLKIAKLTDSSRERIMRGYMMRNVLTESGGAIDAESGVDGLETNDEILRSLPNYLQQEVAIYARAEVIHRREKLFLHCSNGFLVALSSNLTRTRTLLSGDYLRKRDQRFLQEFAVIESGSLQVRKDGHTVKTLKKGHCFGKAWLLQLQFDGSHEFNENADWLRSDGTSAVSIRALGPCVLMSGLSTVEEIRQLERGYQVDFQLLRAEVRGSDTAESERKQKAMRGIAKAVRIFKERRRLSRGSNNGGTASAAELHDEGKKTN